MSDLDELFSRLTVLANSLEFVSNRLDLCNKALAKNTEAMYRVRSDLDEVTDALKDFEPSRTVIFRSDG